MKSIQERERALIVRYIKSIEGESARVEFRPTSLIGHPELRGVFVNGKFYSYHADLVEMANSVGMK